ncbi:MAG: M48 family metallopeptidase [Lachnospiraceae bacterium]|nr:M48 family metallopeptidase [Lachnospiraceae bacterium]
MENAIYTDGSSIPLGDGSIRLSRIRNRDEKHIRVYRKKAEDGSFCLCMVSGIENNPQAYRNAVTGWLREYARVRLGEKVLQYAKQMQVNVNRIAIKEQKTRWGSCSSKGNLNFNWKLVLMPERIQDYVVVHELAHRKEMNHSPAFWAIVEEIQPDYKERRAWLREHEREFLPY